MSRPTNDSPTVTELVCGTITLALLLASTWLFAFIL